MLRKFFIWLVKSLITLVLITLIFSTVALELPSLIKGVFSDIFKYASPEAQKGAVGKLAVACSALDEKSLGALQQMPNTPMPLDFSKIGALCKDYNSGKVNDPEFFFGVIGSAIPEKLDLPQAGAFEKYNSVVNALNKNRFIYFAVLAVLLGLLYLLIMDIKLFTITLTGISFSMGALILIPYAGVIAYDKFVGIDTTPLLSAVLGKGISFDAKAIISVGLLIILRTYSSFIIMLGILLLGIGIAGKVYSFMLKRKGKNKEREQEKDVFKKKSKAKRSSDKKDERDAENEKVTKDDLDELEEMQKKKN